ncbi:MAG TPA: hypothetical protein VMS43_13880 [Allosphingosinicella sp.]|nr:hypothetical protein [Allosphingosinicella sp.]
MMFWPVINMIASMIVAGIVTYKLGWRATGFTCMERIGMALTGAGCILSIGPIMWSAQTPFEDWSGTLLRLGCAVYFIGRLLKHRHNNQAAIRQARLHLKR